MRTKAPWINVYAFDSPRDGSGYRALSRHISPKAAGRAIKTRLERVARGTIPAQEFEIWIGGYRLSKDDTTLIATAKDPVKTIEQTIALIADKEAA